MKIKELVHIKWILGIFIHASLLWVALALGYNSYKKLMAPLEKTIRNSIKATFPWAILIFSGICFVILIRKKVGSVFLNFRQYVFAIVLYAVVLNLLTLSKGEDVFISLNLSVIYLAILLLLLLGLSKYVIISNEYLPRIEEWLPSIVYRFLISYLTKAQTYIIVFMVLLIISAFLLIVQAEKVAEQLANIAYFSLVFGIGIELYQMIKHKNVNEDKED